MSSTKEPKVWEAWELKYRASMKSYEHRIKELSTYRLIMCSKIKAGMIVIVIIFPAVDNMSAIWESCWKQWKFWEALLNLKLSYSW